MAPVPCFAIPSHRACVGEVTAGLLSPTISPVRNFVIAFLVLFLPMQWGTAVLAAYCLHEEGPAAVHHIGHHAHHRGALPALDSGAQPREPGAAHPGA